MDGTGRHAAPRAGELVDRAVLSARGVLYPRRLPDFRRLPPPPGFEALVRWVWVSLWSVPPGEASRQEIVAFPACNLVVERDVVGVSGPTTAASHRDLVGTGHAVGVLLRPAAVPAVVGDPASVRDDYRALPEDAGLVDLRGEVAAVLDGHGPGSPPAREGTDAAAARAADLVGAWVRNRVGEPDEDGLLANRLAELADSRPDLVTVEALAEELSLSVRAVQRLARRHVGVTPGAMIRRRRLQEAAERIRTEPDVDLGDLAHETGYADHAHLCRDFRTVLGLTPGDYRRRSTDAG